MKTQMKTLGKGRTPKLPKLTMQEQIDNHQIIDRMNRKVTFSKNPRHLINQNLQYSEALNATNNQIHFKIEPSQLFFGDYQVGRIFQSEIKLINRSKYIQRIKITPFKNKEFVIARIKYPRQDTGDIAPGMSATLFVRFRPSSLGDFAEQLIVIASEGSILKIPINAQRQKSDITWPKSINLGHCWVGDSIKKQIRLKNRGGDNKFDLLNESIVGFFKVQPLLLIFEKGKGADLKLQFYPQTNGQFQEKISFKSSQGEQEQVQIILEGGAYNAQVLFEELNNQKVIEARTSGVVYLEGCQLEGKSQACFKIKNLAVVEVEYLWNFENQCLIIDKKKGKMKPQQIASFEVCFTSKQKIPESIPLQLLLFNLPKKSLQSSSLSKNINGVEGIQCLTLEIQTTPMLSEISVSPEHIFIEQPLYENYFIQEDLTIFNDSNLRRSFDISLIKISEHFVVEIEEQSGHIEPCTTKKIKVKCKIVKLSTVTQRVDLLLCFDNAKSQIVTLQGNSTYPILGCNLNELYYGLTRTFTLNSKRLTLKNDSKVPLKFKVNNKQRFYDFQFYEFYEYQGQEYFKRRFSLCNSQSKAQLIGWQIIQPESSLLVDCYLNTMEEESILFDFQIQVQNGQTLTFPVCAEVQDVSMDISRKNINLKNIYKGNLYNSNKFLSKELQIRNECNFQCGFQIILEYYENCLIKISPTKGTVKSNSYQRLDLIIDPIKTGPFNIKIAWKYFDLFKANPDSCLNMEQVIEFNEIDGKKSLIKEGCLQIEGNVKGMEVNYYLKDQSKAKKVRHKIEELGQSVKLSTSSKSFKSSSKTLLENEKLVYPVLEEVNFYNCEINQVRQIEIMIQNDSGLTTQFSISAENFHTLEKPSNQKQMTKTLVSVKEEAFSSDMGKTFMKNRMLDKSQKVHLANNKGISILCEPSEGVLHKKQQQKITLTMFNDTSGKFKDNLVVDVKNHTTQKFPIDIHIKGTPVSLSRNQLGIDFNQETPLINIGTIPHSHGIIKKTLKVVNNGPKEAQLRWFVYPYNKKDSQKDMFKLQFGEAPPGTSQAVEVKWKPIKPQQDENSLFSIEPKVKKIQGRQEIHFNIVIRDIKETGTFSNLLVCQPLLIDKDKEVAMESLAVVVEVETVNPVLTMDIKHKNHINKLEKFAVDHIKKETTSNNNQRRMKLKNSIKCNLAFTISILQEQQKQCFKILSTSTNSPTASLQSNALDGCLKSFVLTYDSFVEVIIELNADPKNHNQWPLEEKIRRNGKLLIEFSNGTNQIIDLAGWLYRPWLTLQMPNQLSYSIENQIIDFGTIHVKNSIKKQIFLVNPSKVDAKWNISYIKYHQSIKYKFEQTLWTDQDYEDQKIQDQKKCWKLNTVGGVVRGKSTPVHYIPGTLALPSQDDQFTEEHKPAHLVIMFQPESNKFYKSKFRMVVEHGGVFDIIVRGRGTYEEQIESK